MYGGNCTGLFCRSTNDLAMLATKYGLEVKFYYLMNESLIQRARSYCVETFLQTDCTHLLFIDADIAFNAKDVFGILSTQMEKPDTYNVLTAPYPKKVIAWEKVIAAVNSGLVDDKENTIEKFSGDFVFNVTPGTTHFSLLEPVEIMDGGTGFMLIPRETFDKFKESYPEQSYIPDHQRMENFNGSREIVAYFDTGIDPKTKRYLSEDYFFTQKCREAGLKVWMCPWIELKHVGTQIYSGTLRHLASIGASHGYDKEQENLNKTLNKNLTRQQKRKLVRKK